MANKTQKSGAIQVINTWRPRAVTWLEKERLLSSIYGWRLNDLSVGISNVQCEEH